MYQVTRIQIELLDLPDLLKAREAIEMLSNLDIREVDTDVRRLINELISKKEQTRG